MVFITLLNRSIMAGWFIIAVILFRVVLPKAPKWIRCLLWGLVAVRLICPFSFESAFSLIPSTEIIPQNLISEKETITHMDSSIINQIVTSTNPDTSLIIMSESVSPVQLILKAVSIVWGMGIMIMLTYARLSYLRISKRVSASVLLQDNIYLCDYIKTPFILGIFKPRIIIPSALETEILTYVVAHENAHLKRHDHWWKPLGFILLSIYWFQPMVWIAYLLFCRDIELACDEKVMKELGEKNKKAYSNALLFCSVSKKVLLGCPVAFGEVGVKERIKAVLHYKKPAFWLIVVSVLVCVVAAVCFLTNPITKTKEPDLSFLNYENAISLIADCEEIQVIHYPTEENAIRIGMIKGNELAKYLDLAEWTQCKAPSETLYSPGSIEFVVENDYRITIHERKNLSLTAYAIVRYGKETRYYQAKWKDYENLLSLCYSPKQNISSDVEDRNNPEIETKTENTDPLQEAIVNAIITENKLDIWNNTEGLYDCANFILLGQEKIDSNLLTVYGMAMYHTYQYSDYELKDIAGNHIPTAITFAVKDDGYLLDVEYVLREYWKPRSGSYYEQDIRDKFPNEIEDDVMDTQKYVFTQVQACYEQAVQYWDIDTDIVIEHLLEQFLNSPNMTSSNVKDYIDAHLLTYYRELIYYGKYTLQYCFKQFLKGNQTDLKSQIMANVCNDISLGLGQALLTDYNMTTGQDWFDAFKADTESLLKQYTEEELKKYYPVSWILKSLMLK